MSEELKQENDALRQRIAELEAKLKEIYDTVYDENCQYCSLVNRILSPKEADDADS